MINPLHKMKRFVRYDGNDKPANFYITDGRGWLATGVKDCKGHEIFEGDRVKVIDWDEVVTVTFHDAAFWLGEDLQLLYNYNATELEVVGHVTMM